MIRTVSGERKFDAVRQKNLRNLKRSDRNLTNLPCILRRRVSPEGQ